MAAMAFALLTVFSGVVWAFLHFYLILPRLSEPEESSDKVAYRNLVTPAHALQINAASALTMMALFLADRPLWPLWWVLGSVGLVLVWIDLHTTYLPAQFSWWCFTQLVAALGICLLLNDLPWTAVVRSLVGSGAAGGFYWLVWRFSRGSFGFGDVRLALLLGLVSAASSWTMWWAALFCGSLLGALYGIAIRFWRKTHPSKLGTVFAYGPPMFAGNYAALAWLSLIQ